MKGENDYFRLLFKDHLGSTRSVAEVQLPQGWDWQTNWSAIAFYDYDPYGRIRHQSEPGGSTKYRYTGKERDGSGLDYFGVRYYDGQNLAFRWISPDPAIGDMEDPQSLNKYTYCRSDPVNFVDPDGRETTCWQEQFEVIHYGEDNVKIIYELELTRCGSFPRPTKDGVEARGGGFPPESKFPECNPKSIPTIETKLDWIFNHYGEALAQANAIQPALGDVQVDTGALATMFLQWSAWESRYGQDPGNVAQHNFFGFQKGSWAGEIPCPKDSRIASNSTNACFPTTMTWGQQLATALGAVSGKTRVTYMSALQKSLRSGASMAAALQAIADNGWNASPTYGSDITGGVLLQRHIDCLKSNGYLK